MRVPFSEIPAGAIFRQFQDSLDYWVKRSSRTACLYMVNGTRRAGPFYFRQGDTYYYDPDWSALGN